VTDQIPGTDPSGPDSPGLDATSDQVEFVTGLLATLRSDDPAMPEDVASRLDAVLAESSRARLGPESTLVGSLPGSASQSDDELARARATRRKASSPSLRSFRVLAGVAAAAVLVLAGAVIARGSLGGPGAGSTTSIAESARGMSTMSGSAADSASSPNMAQAPIAEVATGTSGTPGTSGTDYHQSTLATQIAALLVSKAASPSTTSDMTVTGPAGPPCLAALTGRPDVQPRAVDSATFEGRPALIIVVTAPEDVTALDVWAIAPGCSATDVIVLTTAHIPAP